MLRDKFDSSIFFMVVVGCTCLLMASCSRGLKIYTCVLNAPTQALSCANANGQRKSVPVAAADNYVCFSPSEANRVWTSCRVASIKDLEVCVVGTGFLYCSTASGKRRMVSAVDANNYVCLSPDDAQTVFDYCGT